MRSKARAYVMSLRLRTLPLSLGGVLLGSLLSASDGRFDWVVFTLVMVTAAALQILSNMANEIGDLDKGTDNERRLGPIRGTQSGVLSRREMARAMVATGGVALVSGVALVAVAFGDLLEGRSVALLVAGGFSMAAAVKYTLGRNAYGYHGLGDVFVFIFFGLVSVAGSYFAMSGTLPWVVLLPAASVGLLSMGVLNMNNIRDMENDAACGKRTLPVRFGMAWAKRYEFVIVILAFALMTAYAALHPAGWAGYVFWLSAPLFGLHLARVRKGEGRQLDGQLKFISLSTLLLVALCGLGQSLGC